MKNQLTEEHKKKLCEIIVSGEKIHENVLAYLRKHNLPRSSSKGPFIKNLIHSLIDEFKLNETHYIPNYPNTAELNQTEFDVIVGGLLGDS